MALGISKSMVILMAVLAFVSWAVWLGGLAAMQSYCIAGAGFETNVVETNGCGKWYRLYWFLMAFELFLLLAVFGSLIANKLAHSRLALLALLTSSLTLYIIIANAILTGLYGNYYKGRDLNTIRAAAAGAIMVAASNALLLGALGTTPEPVGEYGAGYGKGTTGHVGGTTGYVMPPRETTAVAAPAGVPATGAAAV